MICNELFGKTLNSRLKVIANRYGNIKFNVTERGRYSSKRFYSGFYLELIVYFL